MFDPETSLLISRAPALPDLDRENLAKALSESFAKITSARIRMRTVDKNEIDETLVQIVEQMRRLARTNEALVAVNLDREDRAAAAFVAGTAHQLVFNAEQLKEQRSASSKLTATSIPSDVSTVLLFLIAEATADACEAASRLKLSEEDLTCRVLIEAISSLAQGKLQTIIGAKIPNLDYLSEAEVADIAVAALYRQILIGIQILAKRLSGQSIIVDEDVYGFFMQVRDLCISEEVAVFEEDKPEPVLAFAGPYHLATLLAALSKDLLESSVAVLPSPYGLDDGAWKELLCNIAIERPYLWRNHRQAIEQGYLETGTSSVVGFPTGAGKSTLSELKIGAALLAGAKVVFLAPTLALVDQTASSLTKAFPRALIGKEQPDPFATGLGGDELADVLVLTPESCLAQMSFDREEFKKVGLLIFDECHLLHPSDRPEDRRPMDAMLCLLNLIRLADNVDVLLLSAMMKNTNELADWIADLTKRRCLSLSLAWKPTRQIRGCIVYSQNILSDLRRDLQDTRNNSTTKGVPAHARRKLGAQPLGFFSLNQTWATRNADDYSLQPLLDEEVLLGANANWHLTPNSGEMSAAIGSKNAQAGIKTLIFFQTIKNANSAANKLNDKLAKRTVALNPTEELLYRAAIEEFGDSSCLYLNCKDSIVDVHASIHHGQLLPVERKLVESLFKRQDGLSVLCATSTLAQGMNLPSEMVIIAEDSRFDQQLNRREILEAQELLNAAGRAGRAGMIANGMVLVIPGRVVGIDIDEKTIGSHWGTLLTIFGQSDQCLDIDDPLSAVMDRIQNGASQDDELAKYCISRLQHSKESDESPSLEMAVVNSLSGFRARRNNSSDWLRERIAAVNNFALESGLTPDNDLDMVQELATLFGFPTAVVSSMEDLLASRTDLDGFSIQAWTDFIFDWLANDPLAFNTCLREENISSMFGRTYEQLGNDTDRKNLTLPKLKQLIDLWIAGRPLKEMEETFQEKGTGLKNCTVARRFVIRCVPDLSYCFSLPAKLLEHQQLQAEEPEAIPQVAASLSRCVRFGFNSLELLALQKLVTDKTLTRRQIHQMFEDVLPHLIRSVAADDYATIELRVEAALRSYNNII